MENNIAKKTDELRGYLKAAEAKERLREYKQKAFNKKENEIRKLVNFQSTSMQAIRLERLTEHVFVSKQNVPFNKDQIKRIEELLAGKKKWLNSV